VKKQEKPKVFQKTLEKPKALRNNPRTQDSIEKPKILGENPRGGNAANRDCENNHIVSMKSYL